MAKRETKRITLTAAPFQTEAEVASMLRPYDELYGPKGFTLHGIEDTGRGRVVLVYVRG
jgi:hypothetical protein